MGASAQGEIALLAQIAAPTCGLITNIGRAHLEGFGGVEGIRRGKGELYDYLAQNGGLAFVRSDDEVLSEMASEREQLKCVFYGTSLAENIASKLVGEYNKFNIAAAVAVGRFYGISERDRAEAVATYEPSNNRSQQTETERNMLTVDCYNANPSSMAAAIENHAKLCPEKYAAKIGRFHKLHKLHKLYGRHAIKRRFGIFSLHCALANIVASWQGNRESANLILRVTS
jgi:UDP-N-acetylmuramoyl-tripeptide--D-alanyl-D-alanine ligase